MIAFLAFYISMNLRSSNNIYAGIVISILYVFLAVKYWFPNVFKVLRNFKEISYDNENLYIKDEGSDIILPLHKIRDVELVSLDGLYEFKLNPADNLGEAIYVKPSMWYPFNYPKVDAELDQIRYLIKKDKEKYYLENQTNQLNSIN